MIKTVKEIGNYIVSVLAYWNKCNVTTCLWLPLKDRRGRSCSGIAVKRLLFSFERWQFKRNFQFNSDKTCQVNYWVVAQNLLSMCRLLNACKSFKSYQKVTAPGTYRHLIFQNAELIIFSFKTLLLIRSIHAPFGVNRI